MNQVMYVPANMFVSIYVDETGSHQRDLHHEQGCGLSGAAPVSLKFHIHEKKNISYCRQYYERGGIFLFSRMFRNNFREYFCSSLLTVLHPFKGSSKCLIVIMDSASIHHVDEVRGLILCS